MKSFVRILISLLLVMVFISCEREDFNIGGVSYFPHTEGSVWEYTDSLENKSDMKLQIMRTEIHDYFGEVQEVDRFRYNDETQEYELTEIFYILADSGGVYRFPSLIYTATIVYLQFPLSLGKVWEWSIFTGEEYLEFSAKVVGVESVSTPSGSYSDCIKVENYWKGDLIIIWYAEGVGMVRMFDENVDSSESYDFRLSSYQP